jgi:uncharacterized protein (TIGR00369 family)
MRETDDERMIGHAPVEDFMRGSHGGLRTGALLTMLDNVGGLRAGIAALPDGWVVSTNLAAHVVAVEHVGPLRIESDLLRRGRNNVVTSVQIRDEGARDALVVDGVLTSAILVPHNGPPVWSRPIVLDPGPAPKPAPPPITEWLGVRSAGPNAVEIDLADPLRNPWGILHGGVVATLVDLAAEHATGRVTADVVLHFLAPNRTGPVRADARVLGTRADGAVVRVELRDEGAARTTALAVATTRV